MLGYDFEAIYKKIETKYGGKCTLKKIWGGWGITLCYFYYTTQLDSRIKGIMEEWPTSVDAHSKVTKGSQCIRYFLCGEMIHYGIRISYVYLRNPNSSKRYFWNYTPIL